MASTPPPDGVPAEVTSRGRVAELTAEDRLYRLLQPAAHWATSLWRLNKQCGVRNRMRGAWRAAKNRSGGCSSDTKIISVALFMLLIHCAAQSWTNFVQFPQSTFLPFIHFSAFVTPASSLIFFCFILKLKKIMMWCEKKASACCGVTFTPAHRQGGSILFLILSCLFQFDQPRYLFCESNCCPHSVPLALAKTRGRGSAEKKQKKKKEKEETTRTH